MGFALIFPVVHADQKLTAFLELERAIYPPVERTMLITIAATAAKRFVMHADEKLTVFMELERAVCKRQGGR
jgi:hypothetical protein